VAAGSAVAGAGTRRGEEPLRAAGRREAPHASLALAGGLVDMLSAIVAPLMLALLDAEQHLTLGGPVARQLVGEQHARHVG